MPPSAAYRRVREESLHRDGWLLRISVWYVVSDPLVEFDLVVVNQAQDGKSGCELGDGREGEEAVIGELDAFGVPPIAGHDDRPVTLGWCCHAARQIVWVMLLEELAEFGCGRHLDYKQLWRSASADTSEVQVT